MEDEELFALKNMREKLLAKANSLVKQLKMQEEDDKRIVTLKLLANTTKGTNNLEEKLSERYEPILCEASQQISGITFENTDRKWLHDSTYKYTTYLTTKALKLHIELTVTLQEEAEFEICDITCHFINIDKCYMLEIEPWVKNLTRMKNFSLLTSAISEYNEQSVIRKKIINNSKVEKYVNCEQCTDGNGGILIYVHSPKNKKLVYLIFQWSLLFLEQTWQIEQYFLIKPDEAGIKFVEENRSLLRQFCKPHITKQTLVDLWSQLCSAIDSYEGKDQLEMDCNNE